MVSRRPPGPATVDEYLAALDPPSRKALERLRRTIRAAAPGAVEVLSYRIPAFRLNGMLVWYAAFREHLSFYTGGTAEIQRQFSAELQPFRAGKGTIHFTPERPLPTDLVRRIVEVRIAQNLARRRERPAVRLSRVAPPRSETLPRPRGEGNALATRGRDPPRTDRRSPPGRAPSAQAAGGGATPRTASTVETPQPRSHEPAREGGARMAEPGEFPRALRRRAT